MIAIPLVIIVVLNFTVNTVTGFVSVPVDSISLSSESEIGKVGESFSLDATFTPKNASNKNITWKSDNENVATVDRDGNVIFVGYGKCYITAITEDGNKKASCYFYISDTIAHDLDFYSPKETINVGETVGLQATVLPVEALDKEVEFKSYDESVATIDQNGFLKALNPGFVTLSATATETGITKFLSVLVVRPITSFSVSEESVVVSELDYQIKIKTYPQDATQTELIYTSSNTNIATVNKKGYVTFKTAGQVNVKIEDQNKTMSKTISVRSTAGFAHDVFVSESVINTMLSDAPRYIEISVSPKSISLNNLEIRSDNPEICEVDENNYLQVYSTGSTTIRVCAQTAENVWIEKTILVNVTYPAEGIVLDDVIYVAENSVKLQPVAFPQMSTNNDYFFHSKDESKAIVNSSGVVEKIAGGVCEVEIQVFANSDNSDVSKTTKIIFTNGHAKFAKIIKNQIALNVGQTYAPEFDFAPIGAAAKSTKLTIKKQIMNSEGLDVVKIENGEIVALHGGSAELEIETTFYDDTKSTFDLAVDVTSLISEISYVVDLEKQNEIFVSGQPTFNFSYSVAPVDASNKTVVWKVVSGPAVIHGQSIKFNSKGTAQIVGTSEDGAKTVEFKVRYVGPSPLSATLSEIPQNIMVGDTFEIEVLSTSPKNAMLKNISYQVANNSTSSLTSSKVLDVVDGKLKAVAGGTCSLYVNVSASCQYVFDIEVTRLPETVVVNPSNIQTTKSTISLSSTVLPYDTTNKEVVYIVENADVAEIENDILTFKKNGVANIIAKCVANEDITYSFQIEKIDKTTTSLTPTNKDVSMQIGEKSVLDVSSFCQDYETYSIDVNDEYILNFNANTITALSLGSTSIDIYFYDKVGTIISFHKINVNVVRFVQSFDVLQELDFVSGEYQTAVATVELTSSVLPKDATNQKVNFEISESFSSIGEKLNNIAYIDESTLHFLQSGLVVLRAPADEVGGVSKLVRVRYTGGNATSVEVNFSQNKTLEIGEEFEIVVTKWIPKNTTNKQVFVEGISNSDILKIDGGKIVAISGGSAKVRVEMSSGITKILNIEVNKKVDEIYIENDEILTSKTQYSIVAKALPEDATDKRLIFEMLENDIATLEQNVVKFKKAGRIEVKIYSQNKQVSKNVFVTSTFGALQTFELNSSEIKILKNSNYSLIVTKYYPTDFGLDKSKLHYEIVENKPQNSTDDVVVFENGKLKANYGGTAKVRVYFENTDKTIVENFVDVEVVQILQSIDVTLSREVDDLYGTKVVGQNQIDFSVVPYPLDANIKRLVYLSSDEQVAIVNDKTIKFIKGGKVDITIQAYDGFDNISSKTISFYFTNGEIIDAVIDTTGFVGSTRKMMAGDCFEIKLKSSIPRDVEINQNTMIEKVEKKNHDSLSVLKFENGVLTATAGGEATFKLKICSFVTSIYKIEVTQNATQIVAETSLYTSSSECNIIHSVLPLDASDKQVEFKSENLELAQVNEYGHVIFKNFGVVNIVVSLKSNAEISTTIKIKYSNDVSVIMFKNAPESIFVRESLQLGIDYLPFGAKEFDVEYSVSDETLATINMSGKLFAENKAGTVVVRAQVVGKPEIYAEITIRIKLIISDIELELDQVDDDCGIGGYRVFGNGFISTNEGNMTLTNTYKMGIKSITPNVSDAKLVWISSDENIATVDENGIVTFIGGVGVVTIIVQPLDQLSNNEELFLKDSYTFNVVHGINVYNAEQLKFAMNKNISAPIVIQNDIVYNESAGLYTTKSFHGNGHLLDLSYPDFDENGKEREFNRFVVNASNVVIDNLQLRAASFDENASLSSLEGKGCAIRITTPQGTKEIVKNVVVKNSIMENGVFAARVTGAQVTFAGCIIRNSFSGGLTISVNEDGLAADVTVEDSIFKGSYLSSILFDVVQDSEGNDDSKLTLVGDVKIMNWIDVDEINGQSIAAELGDATSQLREIIKKQTHLTKYYNGKYYFMAGITALKAGYEGVITFQSKLNVDITRMSSTYKYVTYKIEAMVKIYGVPVAFEMSGYSLPSSETEILPDMKIEDDPQAYQKIRQPR